MTDEKRGSRGSDDEITPASPRRQGQGPAPADVHAGRDAARTSGPAGASPRRRAQAVIARLSPELKAAEAERKDFQAALPILRRLQDRLEGPERHALRMVLNAVQDGLDGRPWPSLAQKAGGQGMNTRQRDAIAYGLTYVAQAEAGRIDDPKPVATIRATYSRRADRPVTSRTWRRWKTEHRPDTCRYDKVFAGTKEQATERARAYLKYCARFVTRGPAESLAIAKMSDLVDPGETEPPLQNGA